MSPSERFGPVGEVVALSWPVALGMLGETATGLVDTKLVGALGSAAQGGVGIAITLMYLNYAMVFGLMRAVKVRTANAVGRGNPEEGRRYAQAGVLLGLCLGLAVWALGRDVSWALRLLQVDPALVVPARDFFAARTWGAPMICTLSALVQHRQALGDTSTPMGTGLAGNVLNALLAFGLIHGRWGLPALGVAGAGYATASSELLQVLALGWLFARDAKRGPRPTLGLARALREVLSLGVPTGLQFGLEMLAFTAFTAILGNLGASELAAHQVALATLRASFLPGIAVGEAASILVGRAWGREVPSRDEAARAVRASLLVAVGFMAACGVLFAVFGGVIARAFTSDPRVAETARKLLLLAAVFQVLDAVNIVLRGALRGARDVRATAVIGIGSIWLCVPGAALVFGRWGHLGALGGWLGFVGETALGASLLWIRWSMLVRAPSRPEPAREPREVAATVPAVGG